MFALILATLGSAGFGIVVRASQRRELDLLTVGLVNYVVAAAFYVAWSLGAGPPEVDPRTAIIGSIGGVFYAGGFLLMLGPMRWRGLGIVSALLGLSIVIPLAASLVIWRETLVPIQTLGVGLALLAIQLLSLDRNAIGGRLTWLMALGLGGLFLVNGGAFLIQKWYHTTGLSTQRPAYLGYLFGVAAVIVLIAWAISERRVSVSSIGWGTLLGTCNVVANIAILAALDALPGAIVFPVMQAGIMIVAAGFAAIAWREQPGRLGLAGIALAAAAVALINVA